MRFVESLLWNSCTEFLELFVMLSIVLLETGKFITLYYIIMKILTFPRTTHWLCKVLKHVGIVILKIYIQRFQSSCYNYEGEKIIKNLEKY